MPSHLATDLPRQSAGLSWALGRLAQDKDTQAWATLLALAGPDILRVAMRLTGDAVLAEDVMQETLLLVRDHASRFAVRSGDADDDARRWILGVTANASLQLLRRHQREISRDRRAGELATQTAPPVANPGEMAERADESRLLRRELAALPVAYSQALSLHYFAGQDYPALALHLQVPVNTVRTRVHRGLKALRERLARCGLALSLIALTGLLTDLGAATLGSTAMPATAAGLLTSTTAPSTSFAIASSGGLIMATVLSTALAAIVAGAIVPWLHAQEPRPLPAVVPIVQPAPVGVPPPATVPKPAATTAALEKTVTFEFQDTPITDVCGMAGRRYPYPHHQERRCRPRCTTAGGGRTDRSASIGRT